MDAHAVSDQGWPPAGEPLGSVILNLRRGAELPMSFRDKTATDEAQSADAAGQHSMSNVEDSFEVGQTSIPDYGQQARVIIRPDDWMFGIIRGNPRASRKYRRRVDEGPVTTQHDPDGTGKPRRPRFVVPDNTNHQPAKILRDPH